MAQLVFKQEVLETIKKDQILFGTIAATLGLSIRTLSDLLPTNPPRLATASVLRILRERINVESDDLLLEEQDAEQLQNVA